MGEFANLEEDMLHVFEEVQRVKKEIRDKLYRFREQPVYRAFPWFPWRKRKFSGENGKIGTIKKIPRSILYR